MKKNAFLQACVIGLVLTTSASAETMWIAPDQGDWNKAENWTEGLPGSDNSANISVMAPLSIEVTEASSVQGIQKGGLSQMTLTGAPLTLGEGFGKGFNSILVNAGSMEISNDLISTANKRITLNAKAESLILNGDLDTGDQTTQIGNLGTGTLTFNGNRSGGNSLLIVDGEIQATGILSNKGGGNTQVLKKGIIVSANTGGPSIEGGSAGLALRPEGIFRFGANHQIAGFINMNGGTLDLAGFSNDQFTIGNLSLTASSVIDFSDPQAENLVIADVSENPDWQNGATLKVSGFGDGDSLRFGESADALTASQLGAISFDGKPAGIDDRGFVTPSP